MSANLTMKALLDAKTLVDSCRTVIECHADVVPRLAAACGTQRESDAKQMQLFGIDVIERDWYPPGFGAVISEPGRKLLALITPDGAIEVPDGWRSELDRLMNPLGDVGWRPSSGVLA